MTSRRVRVVLAAFVASVIPLLSPSSPLDAQTVGGTVTLNGAPLADASVVLLDRSGEIKRGTLTEPDGSYSLACPGAGTFTVRVGGAGIETWNSRPVTVEAGQTIDLDVVLGSGGGAPADFERRRESLPGVFLTQADIQGRTGNRFTEVLRHIEGVRLIPLPAGNRGGRTARAWTGGTRRVSDRSRVMGGEQLTVRLEGARSSATPGARQVGEPGDQCPPELFVNGEWWGSIDQASDQGPDLVFLPEALQAVEIYTPTIVPPELQQRAEAEWCGVIVVWAQRR